MEQVYDVAVIGAGPSGVAAACYAAKYGAKTVLLEKKSMIGGTAFRADVHTLNGASFSNMDGLLDGITKKAWGYTIFHPESLVDRYYELLKKHSITLLCRHEVISIKRNDNLITSVTCATTTGKTKVSAKYFIDASGTLEVENLLGESDSGISQYCYMTGLIGKVETVGGKCYSVEAKKFLYEEMEKAKDKGELNLELFIDIKPTIRADIAFISIRYDNSEALDGYLMREKMHNAVQFLQEFGQGFENASLISSSKEVFYSALGSFNAKQTLSLNEIIEGEYFNDQIAKLPHKDGEYYIPYAALLSAKFDNLILCGKNIGAATNAINEINAIPTHFETGKAAGIACAIAIVNDTVEISSVSSYEITSKAKTDTQAYNAVQSKKIKQTTQDFNDSSQLFDKVYEEDSFISPTKQTKGENEYNEKSFEELDKFLALLGDDISSPKKSNVDLKSFENDLNSIMNIDSNSIIKKDTPEDEDDLDTLMNKVGEFADITMENDASSKTDYSKEKDLILELFEELYDSAPPSEIEEDSEESQAQAISVEAEADKDFNELSDSDESSEAEINEDIQAPKVNDIAPEQEDTLESIEEVFENLDEYSKLSDDENEKTENDEEEVKTAYDDANDFMSELFAESYNKKEDTERDLEDIQEPSEQLAVDDADSIIKEETSTQEEAENELALPIIEDAYEDKFLTEDDIQPMESKRIISSEDVMSMLYSDSSKSSSEDDTPTNIVEDEISLLYSDDKKKEKASEIQKEEPKPKKKVHPQRKRAKNDKLSTMLNMIYDITEQEEGDEHLNILKNKDLSEGNPNKNDHIESFDKFKAIKDFLYNSDN